MLAKKHGLSEIWITRVLFHTPNFGRPNVLEFKLNSLNWQKKTEKSIIFLYNIWREH
jgi:hypothetical protein